MYGDRKVAWVQDCTSCYSLIPRPSVWFGNETTTVPFLIGWTLSLLKEKRFTSGKSLLTVNNILFTSGKSLLTVNNILFTSGKSLLTVNNILFTSGKSLLTVNNILFTAREKLFWCFFAPVRPTFHLRPLAVRLVNSFHLSLVLVTVRLPLHQDPIFVINSLAVRHLPAGIHSPAWLPPSQLLQWTNETLVLH